METDRYWNDIYGSDLYKIPEYDGWLDKYLPVLRISKSIVDLGCGSGIGINFTDESTTNKYAAAKHLIEFAATIDLCEQLDNRVTS